MRKELAALSKETLIYGLSTVVGRFLTFLLTPFYVNVLHSTSDYGISSVLYSWMAFLNVIYPLGLEGAYFRYASRGEKAERDYSAEKELFSGSFNLIVLFGGILTAAALIAAPSLAGPLFFDPQHDISSSMPMLIRIIRYSALILLCDSLVVLPFAELRLEHRAKLFASIRLSTIVVTIVLNFVLILGFHLGVEGMFVANLIASALQLLAVLPTIFSKWKPILSKRSLEKMLPFGLTNVPAYIGAMMVQVIDRPIVQMYLGLGAVGIYQANYRMGIVMMVLVSLFEYAWRPFFMRQFKTDDAKARLLFARILTYFLLISGVAFLLLAFFLPYALSTPVFGRRLLRADYLSGMTIIPVVLFAYIFQGMYTNFIAGIYIKEKNKVLPLITGIGAAVNVIANIVLIPVLGIMGAALATLAAYAVMAYAIYIPSQKAYPVPYEWKRIGLLALDIGLIFGLDRVIEASGLIQFSAPVFWLRVALSAAAIAGLFGLGFFSEREKQFLRELRGRFKGASA